MKRHLIALLLLLAAATANAQVSAPPGWRVTTRSTLPPMIYATTGLEANVYFNNAIRTNAPSLLSYDVNCAKGTQQNERWTWTPLDAQITGAKHDDITFGIDAYIGDQRFLAPTTTLRVSKAGVGTGTTRKVLAIGDSTGTGWLPELMKNHASGLAIDLQGVQSYTANDSAAQSRTAKHEAIGGASWTTWAITKVSDYGAGPCTGWTLTGHSPSNTDAGRLYWKLVGNAASNVCTQGDFEAGAGDNFTGWEKTGTGTSTSEAVTVHGGTRAAKLTRGAAAGYAELYGLVNLTPGAYTIRYWVFGDGMNRGRIQVYANDITPIFEVESMPEGSETAAWKQCSRSFVVPAGKTGIYIYLFGPHQAEGAYQILDDVTVNSDDPASYTVSLYKNSDGAGGNLVAEGSRATATGAVTLTEQNASGLAGTVTIAYTADDTDLTDGDADGRYNKLVPNNFIRNAGAAPTATFNFAQYLTDTSQTMAADDWVLIGLGINDCFASKTDADLNAGWTTAIKPSADAIIGPGANPAAGSIRAGVTGIRVGILLPVPPASDQDAFGANYGTYSQSQDRRRYKHNVDWLRDKYLATYGDLEAEGIYLVPIHLGLDTLHNMSLAGAAPWNSRTSTTVARQNNGVHPATGGYWQIADQVTAFLRGQE